MRCPMILAAVCGFVFACPQASIAQDEQTASFQERLEAWLPGMGVENIPDRKDSQQALQAALFELGVPGRETELAVACKAVAAKLGPETAKPARVWLLRQLEFSGSRECVDAVAVCLKDKDAEIRDCARRALQNNPAPAANAKLLAALASAADSQQSVAIVNALGYRKDPASVPALAKLLGGSDQLLAAAAANALGRIGGTQAARALHSSLAGAPEALEGAFADGLLRCGDGMLAEGNRTGAATVYELLDRPDFGRVVRLAALRGRLDAAGEDAVAMVVELLADRDPDRRAIAASHVARLAGADAMQALARRCDDLPPSGRILLLGALAARGDKDAKPIAAKAAESDNEELRIAGIRALARLGDAESVPLLIATVQAEGPASEAARDSLRGVYGDGVETAVIAAMQAAETPLRGTLIDLITQRRMVKAVPALLAEAGNPDSGIRDRVVKALGELAGPEHVAPMIAILLATEKGSRRDDVEKAVMFVCNRIEDPDGRAVPVLEVFRRAGREERLVLLSLLGRIGGSGALEEVEKAIAGDDAELKEAGVRALSNWPDASVADRLLDLARNAENESHATWALRAYIRVVTLPDQPYKKMLAQLKQAMELANRDDERRLAVSRAASARDVETLRWLLPLLEDESVKEQACRAIVELAHRRELMEPNQAEFRAALEKVIAATKDRGLADRAKQYLSGL